jgi:hypothetical protein
MYEARSSCEIPLLVRRATLPLNERLSEGGSQHRPPHDSVTVGICSCLYFVS